MFQSKGGGGSVLTAQRKAAAGGKPDQPGVSGGGATEEQGELVLADEGADVDLAVRARARAIAAQMSVPKPRHRQARRRGAGRAVTVRHLDGATELDLERTLETLTENPFAEDDDLHVRERIRPQRSVVLLLDVSGSMKGERVRTAAATVGALAGELGQDRMAVIAFWSDAAVLLELGQAVDAMALLDTMLRIPARGLTNVAFPLELAARTLAGVPARDARVILLSDCVHNAGPDPRTFAGKLPRLDVLLDASGEHDAELGRQLARRGRGRARVIRQYREVAPALSELFQP